jgi:hypothetical protein
MRGKLISSEQSIAAAGAALVWQDEDDQAQVAHMAFMAGAFWTLVLMVKRWTGI